MFFRILLISFISWAAVKLFRILTGKKRPAAAPFRQNTSRKSYDGQAVDAQFEEVDDTSDTRHDD
ncbi:MAG: hypothetical protein WBQ23_07765 [Bacteroidota bacterium]